MPMRLLLVWIALAAITGALVAGSIVSAVYQNKAIWEGPVAIGRWLFGEAITVYTLVLVAFMVRAARLTASNREQRSPA
jgi:hypothetical protein